MKKLIYLLCLLTALPLAAQKKVFTAASLNVDGLPPTVKAGGLYTVNLNKEGPQEKGTLQISKLVSQKGWDFFAVSEAFNYNEELMSEISGIYSTGTFRNKITDVGLGDVGGYLNGTKWFDTDGLNLLWSNASGITVKGEAWTLWNKRNGTTSNGADQLIAKGFRYYCVTVASGMEIDVYIHHMDAETDPADNEAREIQMQQLVDAILASNNKRPIIIMGDTNCRYTRDRIKEIMFDQIDADPRFTMHDPWIDFPRKGIYPSVGSSSIMVPRPFDGTDEGHQGFQTGEVVDKIWWIENTDSPCKLTALNYLQDTDFTWPDGSEISDHYPIVIEFEIEKVKEELTGGEFYLHNNGTGKWMAAGHNWGTRGIVDGTGAKITLQQISDNVYYIKPTALYKNGGGTAYLGDDLYMDNANANEYTFTPVPGTNYVTITLNKSGKNVAAGSDDNLYWADPSSTDAAQQWELVAPSTRLEQLKAQASESNPMNATFLVEGYNMGRNDKSADVWKNEVSGKSKVTSEIGGAANTGDNNTVLWIHNPDKGWSTWKGAETTWTLNHTISNLPNGRYKIECQTFSQNNDATISFNGVNGSVARKGNDGTYSAETAGHDLNTSGNYSTSANLTVTDNKITVSMGKSGSNTSAGAVFVDNFYLTYYGPTAEDLAVIDKVKAAIDDAQAKADAAEYGNDYNNKAVVNAWESRLIKGNGDTEIHNTYIALAKAAIKQRTYPADVRYAILNNSFEMGSLVEWNVSGASNASIVDRGEGNVDNTLGRYYFKADKGTISYPFEVTMPGGLYELKAMVTPGTVLSAEGMQSAAATGNAGELSEVSVRFIIKNGSATITATNSGAFMADNFTLTRLSDHKTAQAYDLVKLAMTDATSRANKSGWQDAAWNTEMARYQKMIDDLAIVGDGMKEFNEIYSLLRARVFAQEKTDGKDFSNAIINPSFELNNGSTLGWDLMSTAGDTGAKPNSDATYTMSNCNGSYVFNTWQDGAGTVISQTIKAPTEAGWPAGKYKLTATAANDNGTDENKNPINLGYVYMEVKGQEGLASQKAPFELTDNKGTGKDVWFEFNVAEGTPEITICFGGMNADGTWSDFGGTWYKVDNFRLTYSSEVDKCFFYRRLLAAIEDSKDVVKNLPARYKDQWLGKEASENSEAIVGKLAKYQELIDKHTSSDHQLDEIGSGIDEVNSLYADLRELIFSQTESGADMSGAITNNSFELGDLTGWTCTADPNFDAQVTVGNKGGTYGTGDTEGTYLFNCWRSGDIGRPIYQVIPNVPSGVYTVTLKLASDAGNKFFIGANAKHSDVITVSKSKTEFEDFSFTFEVPVEAESKDVKIGLYPTINDSEFEMSDIPSYSDACPWYKVDDFRLTLDSRYLEIPWEMETDSHGTIILPYDVEAEVLDEKSLEVYLVTESTDTETPLDDDINTYRLLKFEKAPYLKANTPYVVKNTRIAYAPAPETEAEPVAQKRVKIKAEGDEILTGDGSDPERPRVYTFSGYTKLKDYVVAPENPEEQGKNMLTGILEEREAQVGEHHFQMEGENVAFVLHGDDNIGVDHEKLQPYHAYIDHNIDQYREFVTGFYFYEPIMNLPWEMEHAEYGTLILPFDAELPADLKAYRLRDLSEKRNNAIGTDAEGTYQVLEMEEVTEKTESGLTKITADIPYFITLNNTKAAKRAKRAALRSEGSGNYSYVFAGQPQNTEETYKHDGVMRGTILTDNGVKKADGEVGVHILTADGTFEPLADDATATIGAYHAYVNSHRADNNSTLLLEEPVYDPEWSMESPEYGTIILPYAKDLPEGLEAYPISSIGGQKKMPMGTTDGNRYNNGETYQLIELGEKTTSLEANTPYIVKPVKVEENADVPATLADEAIDLSGYRDHANEKATATVNGLTGVNNATPVEKGDYITTDNANGFEQNAANSVTVNAHHAYLKSDVIEGDESGNKPTYLLVAEPQADPTVNVEEILTGEEPVDIYTLQGVCVARDVNAAETLRTLEPGIYVLRSGDKTVKVIK